MILNPILSETDLQVSCHSLVATGQLDRVIDYFINEQWEKARKVTEKDLVRYQKILQNYEDLGNKIKNAAVSSEKPVLNF
ncbi:hypothetical protein [Herbiconiux daphne]|uniref:Uncharacterized protein n=1 Tax=Herbiconiux daphne TaxID=2970914 RepID=A0ABT2HB43_9MICO|nr:hypothetical protein [Herbiconiux daphne]MCS5737166.1 hypothetical protein [Herbiconiux daphne]